MRIVLIVMLLCTLIITYPFFAIKYFETSPVFLILWNNFFIPVSLLTIIGFALLYFKKVRRMEPVLESKRKQIIRDIATIILGSFFCIMVTNGITLSTIITTNAYFGTPELLVINEPVIHYSSSLRKTGRIEHHIEFKNPKTDKIISLNVYRKYEVGELFYKKMYIGYWGILYAKD